MYRKKYIVSFFFISLIFNSCSNDEENKLAGQWEPVSKPYNLGTTLFFAEDSSYIQLKEARVNYTYELEDNLLISTSFNGLSGKIIIDSVNINIQGDTLILVRGKEGDQEETVMIRYDSVYNNKDGIVGFWKWPHQSAKDAISEFHPDGKASVSVTIERREGYYFVNGDSLTIVMPGTSLRDIHYQLKGDSLFFPDKFAPLGKSFYRIKK
jgi:hypothetical protein